MQTMGELASVFLSGLPLGLQVPPCRVCSPCAKLVLQGSAACRCRSPATAVFSGSAGGGAEPKPQALVVSGTLALSPTRRGIKQAPGELKQLHTQAPAPGVSVLLFRDLVPCW